MYKIKIVLRYLRKRKITVFPMAGVALGVMALVVVLSIMQGFETDFRDRIRGISPDMSIDFQIVEGFTGDSERLATELEAIEEVRAVSPFVGGLGMAAVNMPVPDDPLKQYVYEGYVSFKGFDWQRENRVVNLHDYLKIGSDVFAGHAYSPDGSTEPVFIVGSRFGGKGKTDADMRKGETDWGKVTPGALVQVSTFTPDYELSRRTGPVADIVSSGVYDIDEHLLYMPLGWARALKRLPPGSVTGYGVVLTEYTPETVARAKTKIKALVEKEAPYIPYTLKTWEESRGAFLMAIAMERRIMAFILFFFLVVAGFSIAAILIMIVLEKVRDIGILRAMGASSRSVAAAFLIYGVTIGLVGAGVGLGAGVAFVEKIDAIEAAVYATTGWQPFPPEIYDLPAIPRILNWWTNLAVVASALSVSFAASVIPAVRAAWLDPVEAIRYE